MPDEDVSLSGSASGNWWADRASPYDTNQEETSQSASHPAGDGPPEGILGSRAGMALRAQMLKVSDHLWANLEVKADPKYKADHEVFTPPSVVKMMMQVMMPEAGPLPPRVEQLMELDTALREADRRQAVEQLATVASQVLVEDSAMRRSILELTRELMHLELANGRGGSGKLGPGLVVEIKTQLTSEQSLEQAWSDIEQLLRSDKKLRRDIKGGARRLAPRSKSKRKSLERVMLILVWLCVVLGPWTDGEWKTDDATAPIGALAAEIAARLALPGKPRKNPLQKNGPRRRRHRRKR